MTWFRLDDSFHSHPKVIAAGNEAVGLYVRCGSYAAQYLTDGFIPEDIAVLYGASDTGSRRNPGTGKPETLAETLVRTKLWRRARGGWRMPDYLAYNPSRDAVDKQRKTNAARQRRWQEAQHNAVSNGTANGITNSAPTRPVPTPKDKPPQRPSGADPPRARATRIPDDFTVTPELAAWAATETPYVDTRLETAKFTDYWRAASGQRATKRDWPATWRNWMRRAADSQPARASPRSRQAETDELFDDALARARTRDAQEAQHDPRGNRAADQVRQGMLPPAGHRPVDAGRMA